MASPKRYSLQRAERITRTSEFKADLAKGTIYNGRGLKIILTRNNYGIPRIGVSLNRRYFKNAVGRNFMRRRIKEIFRLNKHNIAQGWDIIVILRGQSTELASGDLRDEFIGLIKKAGIFKDNEENCNSGDKFLS